MGYQGQLGNVNALMKRAEEELQQVSMERQAQLEKLLKKCHSELQDKLQRNGLLERETSRLETETKDQKSLLKQYEERFIQIKKHIEQINYDK